MTWVRVILGGSADHPATSHRIVCGYHQLASVFEDAGFEVTLLEYCDEQGDFRFPNWNPDDGKAGRSYRYDTRNSAGHLGMVSIILDAKKPLVISSG